MIPISFTSEHHAPHPPSQVLQPLSPAVKLCLVSKKKNMIWHDILEIHYLDTYCTWKHTPGN